ncbi:hypothetical protein [Hafnia phage TS33]|nr:hypothetical protein [Hafnia phage TS33]
MSNAIDAMMARWINSRPGTFYKIEFNFFDKPEPFKFKRKPNSEFFKDYKVIRDREAFEDAQLLANIAFRRSGIKDGSDRAFWVAAMQALKSAYGVK